jgi:hypothetical protein
MPGFYYVYLIGREINFLEGIERKFNDLYRGFDEIKGTSKNSYFQKRSDRWLTFEKSECPIG